VSDDRERELRIELMTAQIENVRTDTAYKRKLSDWEPWKAMAVAFSAGAGLVAALVALFTLVLHLMGKL